MLCVLGAPIFWENSLTAEKKYYFFILRNVIYTQASDRILANLAGTSSTITKRNNEDMTAISYELCENEGIVASRPLGL